VSNEDRQIIQEIKDGCRSSYNFLVEKYSESLVQFLFRRTLHLQEAEDIAQETFLQGLKKINTYNAKYSFNTWLFTIARNISIDRMRSKKIHIVSINDDSHKEIADHNIEDQGQRTIIEEEKKHLWHLAQSLPIGSYELLQLFYAEEKTIADIAYITRKTKTGVKVGLYRARKLLLKKINSEENSVSVDTFSHSLANNLKPLGNQS